MAVTRADRSGLVARHHVGRAFHCVPAGTGTGTGTATLSCDYRLHNASGSPRTDNLRASGRGDNPGRPRSLSGSEEKWRTLAGYNPNGNYTKILLRRLFLRITSASAAMGYEEMYRT
ncbi:hypothetical protein J6590_008389 [Homalodisca vitripennis]|nr:hypothetical protein J6590_008389 [Homalodisca vitripennis]